MISIFKPAPPKPPLPADKVDSAYKRYRIQVFLSIFVGYAAYYFIRKNYSMAVPYLMEEYGYSRAQVGFVGSALMIAYGLSKFVMGLVSDRCNPRIFMATGLFLSGIANIFLGFASTIPILFTLMFLNGWFQGMGWPPCGRTMTHWFSNHERGFKMAIWNVSHNLGSSTVPFLTITGLYLFNSWRGMFFFPALSSIFVGIMILIFLRDTPQSVGLMPIEDYRNDHNPLSENIEDKEREMTSKEILIGHVLNNKYIWFIALANMFVYLIRYGVLDWIPLYLKEAKGYDIRSAGLAFSLYEWLAIPGTILVGWMSDKFFNGRRAPMAVICMAGVFVALLVYWQSTAVLAINVAIASIGFLIYGPVMLIGVAAIDSVPKKAAGTAAGFTCLFGYVGGAVLANMAIGLIVDKVGWNGGFIFLLSSCLIAMVLLFMTNSHDGMGADKK